jgi:Ca2+-binding RTX toxin-like protein
MKKLYLLALTVGMVLVFASTAYAAIVGTNKGDVLKGNDGVNIFFALKGNDTVYGFKNHDRIQLGLGGDTAYGGRGEDVLIGRGGEDTLYGNRGNDDLRAADGQDDVVNCGPGDADEASVDGANPDPTVEEEVGEGEVTDTVKNCEDTNPVLVVPNDIPEPTPTP